MNRDNVLDRYDNKPRKRSKMPIVAVVFLLSFAASAGKSLYEVNKYTWGFEKPHFKVEQCVQRTYTYEGEFTTTKDVTKYLVYKIGKTRYRLLRFYEGFKKGVDAVVFENIYEDEKFEVVDTKYELFNCPENIELR